VTVVVRWDIPAHRDGSDDHQILSELTPARPYFSAAIHHKLWAAQRTQDLLKVP